MQLLANCSEFEILVVLWCCFQLLTLDLETVKYKLQLAMKMTTIQRLRIYQTRQACLREPLQILPFILSWYVFARLWWLYRKFGNFLNRYIAIFILKAVDADEGLNAFVSYSISSGNTGEAFAIDQNR